MAQAVAEGVRDAGVEADIKRVPELVPEEVAKQSGFKLSDLQTRSKTAGVY
jgi:NAD(P)H dehydrogenase (quinone)